MPFGPYEDFEDCVRANAEKHDPNAYCATIKRAIEGKEFTVPADESAGKKLMLNVEIFRTGIHVPEKGEARMWTRDDIAGMVTAFNAGLALPVHLKIGHTSDEFCALVAKRLGVPTEVVRGEGEIGNGQISLGRVVSLRQHEDVLLADFEAPVQVVELVQRGYDDVSVEILKDVGGHPWVLSAVALLGAERPAVEDNAPLSEAAILSERRPALVLTFQAGKPGELRMEGNMKTETTELDELAEVGAAIDAIVKGKRSVSMLRSVWAQVKDKLSALLGEASIANQEGDMDTTKLTRALRMQDGAGEEAILARLDEIMTALAAIAEAMGMEGGETPPGEMAAKIKAMVATSGESKFSAAQYTEALGAAQKRIAVLERDKRLAAFSVAVTGLTAIEGTPDALAGELVEVEEKMGKEAVAKRLAEWQRTQKYAREAGVLARIGTSRVGEGKSVVEAEMETWVTEHPDKTMADAYAHFRQAEPDKWREFRAANRNGAQTQ